MKKFVTKLRSILIISLAVVSIFLYYSSLSRPMRADAVGDLNIDWGVPSGEPIFTVDDTKPGDIVPRTIVVTNNGTEDRQIAIKGDLTQKNGQLNKCLTIVISANGSDLYGGSSGTGPKTLADFFDESDSLFGIPLITLVPGETVALIITVFFDSSEGNRCQGDTMTFDLTLGINDNDIDLPPECTQVEFDNIIYGTSGNDKLEGTRGNDLILGFEGNDRIDGEIGDDCLVGGAGADRLRGGTGNDILIGNEGKDQLDGGDGSDLIYGGPDDDRIDGGDNNDVIYAGSGDDRVDGGSQNDRIYGGDGEDQIEGGSGDDFVYGENDDDDLEGGSGNDYIEGGEGDDTIDGDSGDDELYGNNGDDRINGSSGDDVLIGGSGYDELDGDAGDDACEGEEQKSCEL